MGTAFHPEVDQAEDVDQEDRRRLRNQIRRTYRRRNRRGIWLAYFEEHDPELHEELVGLRARHPVGFRKALVQAAKKAGIWAPTNRASPRDLPPMEERKEE
ncbi:MAG: hypothetical protein HN348_28350 [Proteobacteria bacterium]|jgi:hypothetical protein|nr:hypothetical protein [Pseudomonadota bacterium]